MKRYLYVLAALGIFPCCTTEDCNEDYVPSRSYTIAIDYTNSQGQYLLAETNPVLQQSEILVTNEKNEAVEVAFALPESPSNPQIKFYRPLIVAFEKEETANACRRLFIKLKSDIDTIDYCYQMNDCKQGFKTINIKYNGREKKYTFGSANFIVDVTK